MRSINLIPPEQRRGAGGLAGRTGGVVYVLIAGLVALVALGVVYASAVHQVATRMTTLAQLTAEAGAVSSQTAALAPYLSFATESKQQIESVASLAAQRFDWPDAMRQLALSLPSGVTLNSVAGTASGGTTASAAGATGASAATGLGATNVSSPTLAINGCAPSQDIVAATLARLRELQDVTSATVQSYSKNGTCKVGFAMSVAYGSSYAIPSGKLKAGPHSTVGG